MDENKPLDNRDELQRAMIAAHGKRSAEWKATDGRLNVLIAGNTGAGKSTVINEFFDQKDLTPEGVGSSQTKGLLKCTVPESPLIVYDTRGFETGNGEAVAQLETEIVKLRNEPKPEDQIHIAWLCVDQKTGRFEDSHIRFIKLLESHKIPVVIIITRSLDERGELEQHIAERVGPAVPVLNVVARSLPTKAGVVPQEGMTALLEATLRLLPAARRGAAMAAQAVSWEVKDKEANRVVNKFALAAAPAALTPGPGMGMLAIGAVQATMMAELDALAGVKTGSIANYAKMAAAAIARSGGVALFRFGVAQVFKFIPGYGDIAAGMLSGGVAVSVTKALGHAYWLGAKHLVRSGETMGEADFAANFRQGMNDPEPTAAAA